MIQNTVPLSPGRDHDNPLSKAVGEHRAKREEVIAAIPILKELDFDKVTWAVSSNFIGAYLYSGELGITADIYTPCNMGSISLRVAIHTFTNNGYGDEFIEEYEEDEAVMFLIATFGKKD